MRWPLARPVVSSRMTRTLNGESTIFVPELRRLTYPCQSQLGVGDEGHRTHRRSDSTSPD